MKNPFQLQRGAKTHKKGACSTIIRMEKIKADRLPSSAKSVQSAVNSYRFFCLFFVSSRAFLWPIHLPVSV